ncbi:MULTISPECIES: tRNA (guanosine(46)-N7)-methyltransferase TrmB [unclassified Rhizobium]|uniref:tRNA (guanosine(46)-N7)-methyltransferase TrmB n=1 Tax=unclassified Rhizobium TaxID=2613769 RepID=UPI001AD9909F|nr:MULTISPECIES: tRNA (guanosine(46)-N7)-methyltransferase TrmB [unclassified Rhizobium]MBO9097112.1 tRNA (guanosine(46)-N7)-methyltransferase TrmB [Rhizobium sp. L58/93]MBO9134036.1 tRNA (guanosine(46)-N7)-methyltransferase TrmB [Rhizobium sp. B209b/85]MBO9167350.1 tRNA (guanosine(46)-N7)-methyltransferase TrmB [Rhizobium sp. L245/93]MBO9183309.1 tRNA (guanosine(46)-N7)-methyltransferase TrmB [Rhizobium sp. E27B/91]QXZ83650.1 tRNA (guanosine(46)-N7)-methyltransferase TrmB [Rhizobium sp. K1/93
MNDTERRSRATEAFYGRRKGKPLRGQQAGRLETLLPAFMVDLDTPVPASLQALFPVPVERLRLEIGFGGGEHLIHRAKENPTTGFIGVEPFVNSMQKLLAHVEEAGVQNIRVYNDDATQLLDWLPDACLDQIDLLYPDPWPKTRHWKRRFVSAVNLARFHRVLKPGAIFCFASDIDTYINWTLQHCKAHGGFEWTAKNAADWLTPYDGWPGTRYEAKAKREGRSSAYLTFKRV